MTCIVGATDNKGRLWFGGDSAAVDRHDMTLIDEAKVWSTGDFLMGYCGSFRVGQITRYLFEPPAHDPHQSVSEYMVGPFVGRLRKCLSKHGSLSTEADGIDAINQSKLLVGYQGRVYYIEEDFLAVPMKHNLVAIGSGAAYAMGAGYGWDGTKPRAMVQRALEAASTFSAAVSPPFDIIKSED